MRQISREVISVCLVSLPRDHLQGMREQRDEDVHAVLNSLEAAGEVDDERVASQAGFGAGEAGGGDAFVEAVETDGFADAGRAAVDDGERRLGGDITGREARATRGDDGVHMAFR